MNVAKLPSVTHALLLASKLLGYELATSLEMARFMRDSVAAYTQ